MVSGSEAYQTALVFYNSVKMAARQNIPGGESHLRRIEKAFPRTEA
jgi:hypothetical protein